MTGSHPLAVSASAAGLQDDVCRSVTGIAERLDLELQNVDALALDEVRDLARRVDAAYSGAGRRADAWRNAAIAECAAREAVLLAGTEELPNINIDTNTRPLTSGGSRPGRIPASWVPKGVKR